MRSAYAGDPFTTSTAEIEAALADVSIPTLLLSLVHITGDPRFIREFKQMGIFLNEIQGFMSEEDKARARAAALPVITDYRDRGCPEPKPLSLDLIREMMDWTACEHVTDDYLPLILEEIDLDGVDPRRPPALPAQSAAAIPVLVVGCGESGILAGIRLKQANIPFTIVEKNAGPGGTWWENSYPGARVDVANHFYCYSFEPNNDWTHFFAEQHELQDYFTQVMAKHDLAEHVLWNTEVLDAEWVDDDATWSIRLRGAGGQTSTVRARALITAVGQLNRPNIPHFDGADSFAGPSFHSAAWDHSVDVSGKRVALVGAGASGFQIAPAIAPDVGAPHRVSADRAVDVPEPDVSRRGRRGHALGDAPPAVLRTVVPLPCPLARLRQGPGRRGKRPGLCRLRPRRQRHQRRRPDDVLPVDHQPGR